MRAHLVQLDCQWEDKRANYARVDRLLGGVTVQPHDLIVLPEMFDTGFSFRLDVTADETGETRRYVAELARTRRAYVYAGFTMRRADGKGLNRAWICDPQGDVVCEYDKLHPFSFGRESEHFVGGERIALCEWKAPGGALNVCPAVCYDLRFPELFRHGLAAGAELFVIGANWPSARAAHWRSLLMARAIENQAFVLGVNRAGADPHLGYSGGSLAVSPTGEILADAGDQECVATVEIDIESLREWRQVFPAWRDWRPGLLGLPMGTPRGGSGGG